MSAPPNVLRGSMEQGPFHPPLNHERHVRYWLRCLRTLLPRQYTANDSIRMTLGFFIVAALDLLSPQATSAATGQDGGNKSPVPTAEERLRMREWVLSCQHPAGGFCGSTTHTPYAPAARPPAPHAPLRTQPARPPRQQELESSNFIHHTRSDDHSGANIAATSFALLLLALLADPDDGCAESAFDGVDRVATLRWLRRLQRADGSFGEVLVEVPDTTTPIASPPAVTVSEAPRLPPLERRIRMRQVVEGGRDMRFCLIAALIRWVLRGDVQEGEPGWVEDIDVDLLVRHIREGQTYDGGLAESSAHESHAGYAYCAVSALYLLDRPPEQGSSSHPSSTLLRESGINIPSLVQFLVSRQYAYHDPPPHDDRENQADLDDENFPQPPSLSRLTILTDPESDPCYLGFNGRCNKHADTCYCWWVCGTLDVLGLRDVIGPAAPAARRFMIEKTQHVIGGFAKHPGRSPDIYHSYLGLAALAVLGEPRLKEFDASLCVSLDTVHRIEAARRGLLKAAVGVAGTADLRLSRDALLTMGKRLAGRSV